VDDVDDVVDRHEALHPAFRIHDRNREQVVPSEQTLTASWSRYSPTLTTSPRITSRTVFSGVAAQSCFSETTPMRRS
jgi:hypothetical protein